jgi:hypothetical protein
MFENRERPAYIQRIPSSGHSNDRCSMNRPALLLMVCMAFLAVCHSQTVHYGVAPAPWPEKFGNHRAVVRIASPATAVRIVLPWRRHDPHPETRRLLLVEESSGDTVANILRHHVDREACDIEAGPVRRAGTYFLYYLPYTVQPGWGYYAGEYLPRESPPDPFWVASLNERGSFPRRKTAAEVIEIQSRSEFDNFSPMEVIPTGNEKKGFLRNHPGAFLVFPEDRIYPIRMRDEIPYRWVARPMKQKFTGMAMRNEYYAFQLGVYAVEKALTSVSVAFTDLVSGGGELLPSRNLTCFNTCGIDPAGRPFVVDVNVPAGSVQPLWIGVDVAGDQAPGLYAGSVTIAAKDCPPKTIRLELRVADTLRTDRGDSEPWRHSRLRWLNSTAGLDTEVVAPYTPIRESGPDAYSILGREITTAPDGLPVTIRAWGKDVIAAPLRFVVETDAGIEKIPITRQVPRLYHTGGVFRMATGENVRVAMEVRSGIESDGYCRYRYTLRAKENLHLADVRLEIPFARDVATSMIGMQRLGSDVPERHYALWEGPHDSFWLGGAEGGIWCELRGAGYAGPLLNVFSQGPPPSWWNERKGGFDLRKSGDRVLVSVFSGGRDLAAGQSMTFEFSLLITPVKKLDPRGQFTNRYYHNGLKPVPSDDEVSAGVRILNLHHANPANPYINYPFIATKQLKSVVDDAHARALKLKIYYTIRELTSHVTELWALRSLGTEILADGKGGGYPWLREHLVTGYSPQWYQHFEDATLGVDASILTSTGSTRWYNYYIEGLGWLVRNMGIDGLYLDDVAYDREILKRMKKVMEKEKSGCLVDLHSNTEFSKGPANQYAEFFPYVDKLWFGEGFQYDRMPPENWFVEVSGIPFGLMGDMLEGGGNPWRGMLYGMTVRYPWMTDGVTCDPRGVWKVWDAFGIADAGMTGYWSASPVASTGTPEVLSTVYAKPGTAMIALASWADTSVAVRLKIDWARLGFDGSRTPLRAPAIERYQPERTFQPGEAIPVAPGKGWLLIVNPSPEMK